MFDPKKDTASAQGKNLVRVAMGPYLQYVGVWAPTERRCFLPRFDVFLDVDKAVLHYSLGSHFAQRAEENHLTKDQKVRGITPAKDWNSLTSHEQVLFHQEHKLEKATLHKTAYKSADDIVRAMDEACSSPAHAHISGLVFDVLAFNTKTPMRLASFEKPRPPFPVEDEIRSGIKDYHTWLSDKASKMLLL